MCFEFVHAMYFYSEFHLDVKFVVLIKGQCKFKFPFQFLFLIVAGDGW